MDSKYLINYKIKVKDEFFEKFTDMTETRYFVWKGTEIKCGKLSGEIISFIIKAINEYPRK